MTVYLVYYGGGVIGIYDNTEAAHAVMNARNDYAKRVQQGKRPVPLARLETWEVQTKPAPEDLE